MGKERFTSSTSQCLCNNLNMLAKQYKVGESLRQGPYGHTSSQFDENLYTYNKLKSYRSSKDLFQEYFSSQDVLDNLEKVSWSCVKD